MHAAVVFWFPSGAGSPAEFSARLSAVNAETDMHRYIGRSAVKYTMKQDDGQEKDDFVTGPV